MVDSTAARSRRLSAGWPRAGRVTHHAPGPVPFHPVVRKRHPVVRKRVVVSGLVQGVSFRYVCQRMATRHGVAGWVRNRPDGTVEAVFEGSPDQVDQMLRWARQGPSRAIVRQVTVHDEKPEGLSGFVVRA